jgi:hypothetical protein
VSFDLSNIQPLVWGVGIDNDKMTRCHACWYDSDDEHRVMNRCSLPTRIATNDSLCQFHHLEERERMARLLLAKAGFTGEDASAVLAASTKAAAA